ncbi:hypothetical protein LTR04_002895 [Oleoguttula sp. CCFEE 6159]|nr:hypothetical protein LTR04_002895 [Oleoguttula sp. CCFEE 6159]
MSSTSSPAKHEWICILPDHEGALERRMEVRPYVAIPSVPPPPAHHALPASTALALTETHIHPTRSDHLKALAPNVDSGLILFGGGYMESVPAEGEGPKIKGSVMLAYAESKEEVVQMLKNDIYSKKDVWDWEKVQIYPFKSAVRKPL